MVEVLIAMVVMAVGLLGAAGMQVSSMRSHHDAYERTIALHQVSDMADRMRANMPGVRLNLYDGINPGQNEPCVNTAAGCTVQQIVDNDLFDWNVDNDRLLADGIGQVVPPDANGLRVITLGWNGRGGAEVIAVSVRL